MHHAEHRQQGISTNHLLHIRHPILDAKVPFGTPT
jgi:hypothetical protein